MPLRLLLTTEQISQYILHYGGLIFDLIEGYLLVFAKTRMIGIALGLYFHICNSQIFTIGIFPYAMLATMPIYCSPDWPKKSIMTLLPRWRHYFSLDTPLKYSASNCYYDCSDESIIQDDIQKQSHDTTADKNGTVRTTNKGIQRFGFRDRMTVVILGFYVCLQLFLPYSHFITQVKII